MAFRGINEINIDEKGRMVIPMRYRSSLGEQIVVTIDTEQKCLLLYPLSVWEKIEEKISQLPSFNPAARRVQRLLIGHATEGKVDGKGRTLLPAELREYSGIDNSVMFIGQGNKFELWNKELWQENRDRWLTKESAEEGGIPDELRSISL